MKKKKKLYLKKGQIVLTKNGIIGEIKEVKDGLITLCNYKRTEDYYPSCIVIVGKGYLLFNYIDIVEIVKQQKEQEDWRSKDDEDDNN